MSVLIFSATFCTQTGVCECVCVLRQSSQSDGGEEVDGKASVSGIITRKETFEERLQSPETHTQLAVS